MSTKVIIFRDDIPVYVAEYRYPEMVSWTTGTCPGGEYVLFLHGDRDGPLLQALRHLIHKRWAVTETERELLP